MRVWMLRNDSGVAERALSRERLQTALGIAGLVVVLLITGILVALYWRHAGFPVSGVI
jgi:hypothetical protein